MHLPHNDYAADVLSFLQKMHLPFNGDGDQREDTGEHKHRQDVVEDWTEDLGVDELPVTRAGVLGEFEWHDEDAGEEVTHGQVEDVVVGDRAHVLVAADRVDHHEVAEQRHAHDEDVEHHEAPPHTGHLSEVPVRHVATARTHINHIAPTPTALVVHRGQHCSDRRGGCGHVEC